MNAVIRVLALGALVATLAAPAARAADSYPDRFIRLILPVPPGGGTDTLARIIGQKLGEAIGQQIIIDNRSGAAGNIASELVARSKKDGYTLLMGLSSALVVNPSLYADLGFNVERDFAPVSLLAEAQYVLV